MPLAASNDISDERGLAIATAHADVAAAAAGV